MNLLEMFFEMDEYSQYPLNQSYDYYSISPDMKYILLRWKTEIPYFTDRNTLESYDMDDHLPWLARQWQEEVGETFVPYEELEPYLQIKIEMDEPVKYKSITRNPLICVRGTCNGCCNEEEKKTIINKRQRSSYCFGELFPCIKNRPDWNIWSRKWPDFWIFLFDVIDWIQVCKSVNALVVMFFFTPNEWNPELDYAYGYGGQISGNTIRVIPSGKQLEQQYQNYNRRYPTEDRKIEESINYDMKKERFIF